MTDPADDPATRPGSSERVEATRPAVDPTVPVGAPPAAADLGRRRFFRAFAGEIIQTAATVAGAAQALQRASAEAASVILNPDGSVGLPGSEAAVDVGAPTAPGGFRTAFREADGALLLVDQRRLPEALVEYPCRSAGEVAFAIREMVVRGAPAIGAVAAIGLALSAEKMRSSKPYARRATLRGGANALLNSRPTAVNLRWAVDRVMARYAEVGDLSDDGDAIAAAMRREADAIVMEATIDHGRLATFGLAVLPTPADRPVQVLTHCNTGPLACGQFGTALGIVQAAHHAERPIHVWVDETRPYLQGARLTTWELAQAGVSHALLPDVAAGHLMARGEVDVILVGADRVAANGDTANKVGTYTLAVLAARHGIPFYVCAPTSSVDLATPDGSTIVIEERKPEEVLEIRGVRIAPPGTQVRNPAFDVTPAELITGIVTEEGVIRAPFEAGLRDAIDEARARWAAVREAGPVAAAAGLG
ncbi:MAG TPA: S-methyl-5-thioribose-1-phosphate isomerase [Candidatus Limnocylindrales bacterium]|nr:S-methyl-5-thioribose-1-phosphate isomerase [Candidatus Limnocylindrales bacterium]